MTDSSRCLIRSKRLNLAKLHNLKVVEAALLK